MKGKIMNININSHLIVPLVLGLVCAGIVYATLAGKTLPLISTPRAALIALLVIGMAACMGGIGQVGVSGRWFSPLAVIGYLLGAAILVVFIAAFANWKLPFVQNETQAVLLVAFLMGVKFLIGIPSFFFRWL